MTFDDLADQNRLPGNRPPDVLCLDAQGSKLDILIGSQSVLTNAIYVFCELGSVEAYAGQPLVWDVARYRIVIGGFDRLFNCRRA